MFRNLIVLVAPLLLSGCAAVLPVSSVFSALPGGRTPEGVHQQTSVELERDNFVLVATNAYGISKGFSLLGFITIYPATLTKAINRMYASAHMRPGEPQTIANLIIERTISYWILFGIPKVEVHADVVAFTPASPAGERERARRPPPKPPDQGQPP